MRFRQPQPAYALATILILLGVAMFGAGALVTISTLESKISRSQLEGNVAYYAAEAGMTDAVWRLNNNTTYKTALAAGNLNVSYSASNKPATGQNFTVTMVTNAQGPGYATIDVTGTADNGSFTAQRKVESSVFQGDPVPNMGTRAFFGGGAVSITNGSSAFTVIGGDIYSRGSITVNQATVSAVGQELQAVGNYSASSSTVTAAAIRASNLPPAPTNTAAPGYNFTQYNSLPTNRCVSAQYASQTQLRCTPAQFRTLIGNSNNFTFPNAVVYLDNVTTLNNWVRNKTLNFTGLLIVNGDLSITTAATNFRININDPGNNLSGVMAAGNISNSAGTWVVNGVYYASGSMTFANPGSITVNGAIVAGGAASINTGSTFSVTFDAGRASAMFGGTPTAVQVLHWEEEY